MPAGIWRISAVLIPQQKYRGGTGATIFSLCPLGNGGFSVGTEVGEDTRKKEANGRGRTGSCRQPADHGRGICFRSPTRGNGGMEVLQPNAPLGGGASSPMSADLAPPCNPIIFYSHVLTGWSEETDVTLRWRLINVAIVVLSALYSGFWR